MQRYVHDENIARYRKLIAISEGDPARDDVRHKMLLKLFAEELAKNKQRPEGQTFDGDAVYRRRPSLWS